MHEQRNHFDVANKLTRQFKALRAKTRPNEGDTRDVAPRPIEARDEAGLDWIEGCNKDNGN